MTRFNLPLRVFSLSASHAYYSRETHITGSDRVRHRRTDHGGALFGLTFRPGY